MQFNKELRTINFRLIVELAQLLSRKKKRNHSTNFKNDIFFPDFLPLSFLHFDENLFDY